MGSVNCFPLRFGKGYAQTPKVGLYPLRDFITYLESSSRSVQTTNLILTKFAQQSVFSVNIIYAREIMLKLNQNVFPTPPPPQSPFIILQTNCSNELVNTCVRNRFLTVQKILT